MKFKQFDVDIDMADRDVLLKHIVHTAASMLTADPPRKHASGVYVQPVPYDPLNDRCAIDYTEAEARGYFKLDLLNVHLYNSVRDDAHLQQLMSEPDWSMLRDQQFVSNLVHLNNHYDSLSKMPEPVNSIPRLAMFLAVIRPAKRHLIGRPWSEVAKTIWEREDGVYTFKKSHAVAYAHLVVINMNLLTRGELQPAN